MAERVTRYTPESMELRADDANLNHDYVYGWHDIAAMLRQAAETERQYVNAVESYESEAVKRIRAERVVAGMREWLGREAETVITSAAGEHTPGCETDESHYRRLHANRGLGELARLEREPRTR